MTSEIRPGFSASTPELPWKQSWKNPASHHQPPKGQAHTRAKGSWSSVFLQISSISGYAPLLHPCDPIRKRSSSSIPIFSLRRRRQVQKTGYLLPDISSVRRTRKPNAKGMVRTSEEVVVVAGGAVVVRVMVIVVSAVVCSA